MTGMDPQYDYIGMEICSTRWEDVVPCCIVQPDAAFRVPEEWWDEEDNPVSQPGEEETVFLFWRMDEYADSLPTRPALHTIFAAFALLCLRHLGQWGCGVRMLVLRSADKPGRIASDMPAINFQLWQSVFRFISCPFMLEVRRLDDVVAELPAPEAPLAEENCKAAREEWVELATARVEYLFAAIHDAASADILLPVLEEWFRYLAQMSAHSMEMVEHLNHLRQGDFSA